MNAAQQHQLLTEQWKSMYETQMKYYEGYAKYQRMFNEDQQLQHAKNQMGSALSTLSSVGWAPLSPSVPSAPSTTPPKSKLNPQVKAWKPNASAKCFACKGAGEVSSPFNPEETLPCECKK